MAEQAATTGTLCSPLVRLIMALLASVVGPPLSALLSLRQLRQLDIRDAMSSTAGPWTAQLTELSQLTDLTTLKLSGCDEVSSFTRQSE